MKFSDIKIIKWLIGLPMKTKIISAIVAGTIAVGSGVGIGIAVNNSNEPEHTHSYTQQTTTEATCTEKGVITFTCSCNDTYTEEIPALGHDEETQQAQAPTCTEIGWEEYETCKRDGCEYSTYVEMSALDHDKVQHNAQAATCTEIGWNAYETCSRCDYTTYVEIPATGHIGGEWITDTLATYTEVGSKHQICAVCRDIIMHKSIPTILQYSLSNGTYEVQGFGGDEYSEIVVPSEYNGKPITAIGNSAFANTNLISVILPNTITSIKFNAFANCTQLKDITLSPNLTSIASNAFDNCSQIAEYVSGNIGTNTTWGLDKKIYVINTSIQQKGDLEILPGTVILGNGKTIQNFGNIIAKGEKDSLIKCFNFGFGLRQGTLDFEYLELRGGFFTNGASSSSNSYGIKLNNCSFYNSTQYSYIWYPTGGCDIQNCYFENWEKLSIGTSGKVTITYNTFVGCGGVECWAAYGGAIKVNYNNFINSTKYALSIKIDGRIDGRYNWFNTTDTATIEKLIYDGNDDFALSNIIDYSGYFDKKIGEE